METALLPPLLLWLFLIVWCYFFFVVPHRGRCRRHPDEEGRHPILSEVMTGLIDYSKWPNRVTVYLDFAIIASAAGLFLIRKGDVADIATTRSRFLGQRIRMKLSHKKGLPREIRLWAAYGSKLDDELRKLLL